MPPCRDLSRACRAACVPGPVSSSTMQRRQARNPGPCVLLERAHLLNGVARIRSPRQSRRPAGAPQLRATRSLIISQYCVGDRATEFGVDVPLGDIRATLLRPRTGHWDIARRSANSKQVLARPGRLAHHRLGRDCLHGDRRPRFSLGLTPTDEQRRPPGEHRANSAVALAMSGRTCTPKRTETPSNGVVERKIIGAAHLRLDIGDLAPWLVAQRPASPLRRSVSTSASFGDSRDAQTRLTRARQLVSRCC